MAEAKTLVTAEQFLEMNLQDVRAELVDGEVVQMSPPGFRHGDISVTLAAALKVFLRKQKLGRVVTEAGFILRRNPDLVRGPDVAFVSQKKIEKVGRTDKFWPGAPDLAVEVLSPDDRASEILRKVGEYLDVGTRLVWVVDPMNQSVSVYRSLHQVRVLGAGDTLSGEDLLAGFSIKVAEIFAE